MLLALLAEPYQTVLGALTRDEVTTIVRMELD